MEALLAITLEVEKVLGELGKTPFEPFKEKQEEFMSGGNVTIEKQAQVLGSSLVNFNGCQICKASQGHDLSKVCQL
jgi:hypothetical protein